MGASPSRVEWLFARCMAVMARMMLISAGLGTWLEASAP
jgi:cytochrome oxidase assembly protein ShyY1